MFVIGRGLKDWTQLDYVRLAIPSVALLIWMVFTGTSALTPFLVWMKLDHVAVLVVALLVGIVLLVLSRRVNPVK